MHPNKQASSATAPGSSRAALASPTPSDRFFRPAAQRVTPPAPTPGVATDDAVKHVVRPCAPPTSVGGVFFSGAALAAVADRPQQRLSMVIGTAAWSIPRAVAASFPGDGQHLERYARQFACAEINSSFHRPHQTATYARWAAMTPAHFRFAVKLPRAITHDARLSGARKPLRSFLAEASGLGDRLGVLLVQLPPSLAWDARVARTFFGLLRDLWDGPVACEPRHAGWFEPTADRALARLRVTRVAADPARPEAAARPGGWLGPDGDGAGALLYYRWHGSPRMYWSSYGDDWLARQAAALSAWPSSAVPWVIFDNTASGAATANALALRSLVAAGGDGLKAP
jgi:uncharacterized protein YecE (DUF72 family)